VASLRVSGLRVSGLRVSGLRVSGLRVSGLRMPFCKRTVLLHSNDEALVDAAPEGWQRVAGGEPHAAIGTWQIYAFHSDGVTENR